MDPSEPSRHHESRAHNDGLRFETFLSNLAARLLHVLPEELDAAIEASLTELAPILGGDRGGIAQFSEEGRCLFFTHPYAAPGADRRLFNSDLAAAHPWWAAELRAGRPVIVPRVPEGLPEEAVAEWAHAAALGLKSHLALPLKVGDEVLGALGVDHVAAYRDWSPGFLSRLRDVGGRLRQRALPAPGPGEAAAGGRPQPLRARVRVERDRRDRP